MSIGLWVFIGRSYVSEGNVWDFSWWVGWQCVGSDDRLRA